MALMPLAAMARGTECGHLRGDLAGASYRGVPVGRMDGPQWGPSSPERYPFAVIKDSPRTGLYFCSSSLIGPFLNPLNLSPCPGQPPVFSSNPGPQDGDHRTG